MLFAALLFAQTQPYAHAYTGEGSEDFPYLIGNAQDLQDFLAQPDSAAHYQLVSDIDMTGASITPKTAFSGVFDAQGYKIKNLNMEEESSALFLSNGGTIKNLQVECAMTALTVAAGVAITNNGTIENCAVAGAIISGSSAGICVVNSGTVVNSYNKAVVSGEERAGGIAAQNFGDIESCYNSAQVSSEASCGGIVAINDGNISNCYNTGEINLHTQDIVLSNYAGGIAAQSTASISDCYNIGNIRLYNGFSAKSGAIIGQMDSASGSAENCYFDKLVQVEGNTLENKGGWVGSVAIDGCIALSTLEMSGGENLLVFTDILYWTLLADNPVEEKVFYPQLYCFYNSTITEYREDSISSATKHYDSCLVSLYDDYGQPISQYLVFSGESILPPPIEKQGFSNAGWSASLDGGRLSADTIIFFNISLYAVYDFLPLEYSLEPVMATYGEEIYIEAEVAHECADAVISYQWYKSGEELEALAGETNNRLYLTDVVQSGFYQCKATAVCGKYSAVAYDTQKVTINPFEVSVLTPVFTKTYGESDSALVQHYSIDTGAAQEDVAIVFSREAGEDAGSYDILSAVSESGNFNVSLIGETADRFIIQKANYEYSFSFIQSEFTYDGEEHMPSYVADLPEGLSVSITMIGDGISAGEHFITANFSGDFDNYNTIPPQHSVMIINKAYYDMSDVSFYDVMAVYDGAPHNVYMSGLLPEGVEAVFSVQNIKDAGEYATTITFTGDFDNYNTIPPRQVNITILPKGLQPEFHLPDNMIANGQPKVITITALGIIEGDEVNFQALSAQPLVEAGIYVLTAVCDNDNYILYNNTIVAQIYTPEIVNSGDEKIDMKITSASGLRYDSEFISESSYLSNDILSQLGKRTLKSVFYLRLLVDGEDIEPEEELCVSLTTPEGYEAAQSLLIYFYNIEEGKLELLDSTLEGRELRFGIQKMGYYVLSVLPAEQPPAQNPDTNGQWLKPALYAVLAVILALIVALAYLIFRDKKKVEQPKPVEVAPSKRPTRKPLFEPLPEDKAEILRKKLADGTFVDWELNRDLKLYGVFAKDKVDKT
jgi:hypothetical protein